MGVIAGYSLCDLQQLVAYMAFNNGLISLQRIAAESAINGLSVAHLLIKNQTPHPTQYY